MKSLLETLKLAQGHLHKQHVAHPLRVAEELLASVLGCDRMTLYMEFDRPLEEGELSVYRRIIARAAKHEPKEYIMGNLSFYGCRIEVSPSVLIPRQETEILLDMVCKRLLGKDLKGKEAWDICCGSGCLGIGLKKKFPELMVRASDLSKEAIEVAQRNARLNEVEVEVLQGNLLIPFENGKTDFILCNPPYVSEGEYTELDASVRHFEPKEALVSGTSGLEFYEWLSEELPNYLRRGGNVFFEIGKSHGKEVTEIFSSSFWRSKEILQDYSGHDRFFFLEAH